MQLLFESNWLQLGSTGFAACGLHLPDDKANPG